MIEAIEKEFGRADQNAYYLVDMCGVSNKIAFAISFHLIAATAGSDIFDSKKYLNTYTKICRDRNGYYVKEALNNQYSDNKYHGCYNYSALPSSVSYGVIFDKVDEILSSRWCDYVVEAMGTHRNSVIIRWEKVRSLSSSKRSSEPASVNDRLKDIFDKANRSKSGPLFSKKESVSHGLEKDKRESANLDRQRSARKDTKSGPLFGKKQSSSSTNVDRVKDLIDTQSLEKDKRESANLDRQKSAKKDTKSGPLFGKKQSSSSSNSDKEPFLRTGSYSGGKKPVLDRTASLFSREQATENSIPFEDFSEITKSCALHIINAAAGNDLSYVKDRFSNYINFLDYRKKGLSYYNNISSYKGFYKNGGIFVEFKDPELLEDIEALLKTVYMKPIELDLKIDKDAVLNYWRSILQKNGLSLSGETFSIAEADDELEKPFEVQERKKIEESSSSISLDSTKDFQGKNAFSSRGTAPEVISRNDGFSKREQVKSKPQQDSVTGPLFKNKKIVKSHSEVPPIDSRVSASSLKVEKIEIDIDSTIAIERNIIEKCSSEESHVGLDLSNHKLNLLESSFDKNNLNFSSKAVLESPYLPSILLPSWSREKVLTDTEAPNNRKGMGLIWPPEAQVPLNNNPMNGVGRIPVVAAVSKMHAEGLEDEWKSFLQSSFKWRPMGQKAIKEDASRLVSKAVKSYSSEADSIALSIPEGFTEGAQQGLLDACRNAGLMNLNLVPRSVCMALQWCNENKRLANTVQIKNKEGESLGYLVTVSLGMDLWELKIIEIRAVEFSGENWLVPIHDPAVGATSLDFCGISLCKEMLDDMPDEKVWYALHGTDWLEQSLKAGADKSVYNASKVVSVLRASSSNILFGDLDAMSGFSDLHHTSTDVSQKIFASIKEQMKLLKISNGDFLGAVCCGTFSKLETKPNKSLGDSLFDEVKIPLTLNVVENDYVGKGASRAAFAINHGLPSYRTKLIPVEIYSVGRNENGDKEIKWIPLIKGETVEAGRKYEPKDPIRGLSIPAQSAGLDLTLRRPNVHGDYLYRMVQAPLLQKTTQKEGVEIFVSVKPGQGFSQVSVMSSRPGVFNTRLDWRGMKEVAEPEELYLEYIPNVSFIVSNRQMFETAESDFILAKHAMQSGRINKNAIDRLRERLNKWPRAVSNSYMKAVEFDDLFKHKGVLNSNGSLDRTVDPFLVQEVVRQLDLQFQQYESDDLLRLGAWFYRMIPESMLAYTEERFYRGEVKSVHLHTAGLCFYKEEQFQLFYRAFCIKCQVEKEGFFEWFRALRNIVRFQNHALSLAAVSHEDLDVILETLIQYLEDAYRKSSTALSNCLLASMFILKRRRYDNSFLDTGDPRTQKLEEILTEISVARGNSTYRAYANAALKFLHKEATAADANSVLEST